MKVALVHELLTQDGGAEAVFEVIAELFPEAPIYTTIYYPEVVSTFFQKRDIQTSYVQQFSRLPFVKERYTHLLPLLPFSIERFDFSRFDVVISSSSGLVKSVITPKHTFHLCYCHSPARYLWVEPDEYLKSVKANPLFKLPAPYVLRRIRAWDALTAHRPSVYVANSEHVRKRIQDVYRRPSMVVYPFVKHVDRVMNEEKSNFFLAGGRLVPYKRFDIIVKAFNKLGMPLVIFGTGPEEDRLKAMVKNPGISFAGKISEEEKFKLFSRAKAFIHPQEEDFGITMLESLSVGTPVIAYARGGALEVLDESSGIFIDDQSWEAIANAVIHLDGSRFDPSYLRSRAGQFSKEAFQKKFMEVFFREYGKFSKLLRKDFTWQGIA